MKKSLRLFLLAGALVASAAARAEGEVGKPDTPTNQHVGDDGTHITYTWSAVSDTNADGDHVNPAEVTYVLAELDSRGNVTSNIVASVVGQTTLTIPYACDEGPLRMLNYGLYAQNEAGASVPVSVSHIVGTPAPLPYADSFADGYTTQFWWTQSSAAFNWMWSTTAAADDDRGSIVVQVPVAGGWSTFNSGKISLAGAANPKLVFNYATDKPRANVQLQPIGVKPDGTEVNLCTPALMFLRVMDTSWQLSSLPLSSLKDERYVIIKLRVKANVADVPIRVDNIRVLDVPEKDVAVSLTAPEKAEKGRTINVTVKAENKGDVTAESYEVRLYAGNELVESQKGTYLFSFRAATHSFSVPVSALTEGDSLTLRAEVVTDGDLVADNDNAQATVALLTSKAPTPSALNVSGNLLSWSAPASSTVTQTESFEDYPSWATAFAPWTLFNGDEGYTAIIDQYTDYPSQYQKLAYTIFCPDDYYTGVTEQIPCLVPHTGRKYAATPYQINTNTGLGQRVAADDWLISPQLSGEAQTISFWANNGYVYTNNGRITRKTQYPEDFEVLYSTTDTDTASFTRQGESYALSTGEWQEISVELPAGAKYFAIRHTTPADNTRGYIFLVDDITFDMTFGVPVGYNVYRDGRLVATLDAATTSYTDAGGTAAHTYAVTALYADGSESAPVELGTTVGISTVLPAVKATPQVYSLDGRRVDSSSLRPGLYVVNGRKVVVR